MERIFGRMAKLVIKIAGYGLTPTHTRSTMWQYIHKKLLFGADFGLGPYFFKNDIGVVITVNGEHYRSMIINVFCSKLNDMNVGNMWLKRGGAMSSKCHD